MKTLTILLLLLLSFWPAPLRGQQVIIARRRVHSGGGGGLTIVHANSCSFVNSGSPTASCTITATSAGSSLIWACGTNDSATVSSVSPAVTGMFFTATNPGPGYLYGGYTTGVTTGTTSVSLTSSSSFSTFACAVVEVTGLTFTLDASAAPSQSSYSSTPSTGSVTTTHANDTVLGFEFFAANTTFTASAPWTIAGNAAAGSYSVALLYRNVSVTGSYNPTLTITTGGPGYSAVATWAGY